MEYLRRVHRNELIRDPIRDEGRLPVIDMSFQLEGVRYIKPAPAMPRSNFFPSGRAPRTNSTGMEKCPPVAKTFPILTKENWTMFKEAAPQMWQLRRSYSDWLAYRDECEKSKELNVRKPFSPISVDFVEFKTAIAKPTSHWTYADVCAFANHLFDLKIREVLSDYQDEAETSVFPVEYIHVVIREVGEDEANDLASISYVCLIPGFEREERIVEFENMFLLYAVVLGAAYAVKRNVRRVIYRKKRFPSP